MMCHVCGPPGNIRTDGLQNLHSAGIIVSLVYLNKLATTIGFDLLKPLSICQPLGTFQELAHLIKYRPVDDNLNLDMQHTGRTGPQFHSTWQGYIILLRHFDERQRPSTKVA